MEPCRKLIWEKLKGEKIRKALFIPYHSLRKYCYSSSSGQFIKPIMILPVIAPMKTTDKKTSQPLSSFSDQFGLGIQVFKIDSKLPSEDSSKPRKAIK